MGMGADDGGGQSIEVETHGHLFGGGFSVKIDED